MANPQDELEALKAQVAALTARLRAVEQRVGIAAEPLSPQPMVAAATPPPPPPPATPGFSQPGMEMYRAAAQKKKPAVSLEKRIGFWVGRIGIIAMLVGVSYFLKLAIDNKWIGPAGQIAIGLLAGIGLVVWSEMFRARGHKPFSYTLKAVGIGCLYLSLGTAFQIYHLIDAKVAFAAMVVVTASTIALALSQDSQLLAAFALFGGFCTPLLVSSGENKEVVLFSYVGLLDLATLVMAVVRPWRWLLWLSFVGTVILGFGWGAKYYSSDQRTVTVVFTILFGLIFAAIPIATPFKKSSQLPGPSISLTLLPLLNAAIFFLTLYGMYASELVTLTWFALGMAAVYLGLSAAFRQRFPEHDTKALDLLHVAIAIAFITIAIPLKLNGHWITMGWLIESAVLLWIAVKTENVFLRYLSIAALSLGIFRLLFFPHDYQVQTLVFNVRFATYLVAIAIMGGIIYFGSRQTEATGGGRIFVRFAGIALNLLALTAMTWEAYDYFNRPLRQVPDEYVAAEYQSNDLKEQFSYSAIWLGYGAALMVVGFRNRSAFVRWQALILMAVTIGKVFLYDVKELEKGYRVLSFLALGVVLLGVSFAYQRDWLKLSSKSAEAPTEEKPA